MGFPGGSVEKNASANAKDMNLITDPGEPQMAQSTLHHNQVHAPQVVSLSFEAQEPQPLRPPATTTEPQMP